MPGVGHFPQNSQTRRRVFPQIPQIFLLQFIIDYQCVQRREDLRDLRVYATTGLRDPRETPYVGKKTNKKGAATMKRQPRKTHWAFPFSNPDYGCSTAFGWLLVWIFDALLSLDGALSVAKYRPIPKAR